MASSYLMAWKKWRLNSSKERTGRHVVGGPTARGTEQADLWAPTLTHVPTQQLHREAVGRCGCTRWSIIFIYKYKYWHSGDQTSPSLNLPQGPHCLCSAGFPLTFRWHKYADRNTFGSDTTEKQKAHLRLSPSSTQLNDTFEAYRCFPGTSHCIQAWYGVGIYRNIETPGTGTWAVSDINTDTLLPSCLILWPVLIILIALS